jgi:pimeloyl-ACP methyl ester carboxylesterase
VGAEPAVAVAGRSLCLTGAVLPGGSLRLGRPGGPSIVFVPGFLTPPAAYRSLLTPLADHGFDVVVPATYRPGWRALSGRFTPDDEAVAVVAVARALPGATAPLWLGGHSRGGGVAWTAAASLPACGLLLVDPVGGGGPPWRATEPVADRPPPGPVLVLGCGRAGRCAPAGRNHERFAARITPSVHEVVADAGHGDMLDDPYRRLAAGVCGGGATDPAAVRGAMAERLLRFVTATSR